MDQEAYNKKLMELKTYLPFLEEMEARLQSCAGDKIGVQLTKIQGLKNLIKGGKRIKSENLLKCEQVLIKLYKKTAERITATESDAGKTEVKEDSFKDFIETDVEPNISNDSMPSFAPKDDVVAEKPKLSLNFYKENSDVEFDKLEERPKLDVTFSQKVSSLSIVETICPKETITVQKVAISEPVQDSKLVSSLNLETTKSDSPNKAEIPNINKSSACEVVAFQTSVHTEEKKETLETKKIDVVKKTIPCGKQISTLLNRVPINKQSPKINTTQQTSDVDMRTHFSDVDMRCSSVFIKKPMDSPNLITCTESTNQTATKSLERPVVLNNLDIPNRPPDPSEKINNIPVILSRNPKIEMPLIPPPMFPLPSLLETPVNFFAADSDLRVIKTFYTDPTDIQNLSDFNIPSLSDVRNDKMLNANIPTREQTQANAIEPPKNVAMQIKSVITKEPAKTISTFGVSVENRNQEVGLQTSTSKFFKDTEEFIVQSLRNIKRTDEPRKNSPQTKSSSNEQKKSPALTPRKYTRVLSSPVRNVSDYRQVGSRRRFEESRRRSQSPRRKRSRSRDKDRKDSFKRSDSRRYDSYKERFRRSRERTDSKNYRRSKSKDKDYYKKDSKSKEIALLGKKIEEIIELTELKRRREKIVQELQSESYLDPEKSPKNDIEEGEKDKEEGELGESDEEVDMLYSDLSEEQSKKSTEKITKVKSTEKITKVKSTEKDDSYKGNIASSLLKLNKILKDKTFEEKTITSPVKEDEVDSFKSESDSNKTEVNASQALAQVSNRLFRTMSDIITSEIVPIKEKSSVSVVECEEDSTDSLKHQKNDTSKPVENLNQSSDLKNKSNVDEQILKDDILKALACDTGTVVESNIFTEKKEEPRETQIKVATAFSPPSTLNSRRISLETYKEKLSLKCDDTIMKNRQNFQEVVKSIFTDKELARFNPILQQSVDLPITNTPSSPQNTASRPTMRPNTPLLRPSTPLVHSGIPLISDHTIGNSSFSNSNVKVNIPSSGNMSTISKESIIKAHELFSQATNNLSPRAVSVNRGCETQQINSPFSSIPLSQPENSNNFLFPQNSKDIAKNCNILADKSTLPLKPLLPNVLQIQQHGNKPYRSDRQSDGNNSQWDNNSLGTRQGFSAPFSRETSVPLTPQYENNRGFYDKDDSFGNRGGNKLWNETRGSNTFDDRNLNCPGGSTPLHDTHWRDDQRDSSTPWNNDYNRSRYNTSDRDFDQRRNNYGSSTPMHETNYRNYRDGSPSRSNRDFPGNQTPLVDSWSNSDNWVQTAPDAWVRGVDFVDDPRDIDNQSTWSGDNRMNDNYHRETNFRHNYDRESSVSRFTEDYSQNRQMRNRGLSVSRDDVGDYSRNRQMINQRMSVSRDDFRQYDARRNENNYGRDTTTRDYDDSSWTNNSNRASFMQNDNFGRDNRSNYDFERGRENSMDRQHWDSNDDFCNDRYQYSQDRFRNDNSFNQSTKFERARSVGRSFHESEFNRSFKSRDYENTSFDKNKIERSRSVGRPLLNSDNGFRAKSVGPRTNSDLDSMFPAYKGHMTCRVDQSNSNYDFKRSRSLARESYADERLERNQANVTVSKPIQKAIELVEKSKHRFRDPRLKRNSVESNNSYQSSTDGCDTTKQNRGEKGSKYSSIGKDRNEKRTDRNIKGTHLKSRHDDKYRSSDKKNRDNHGRNSSQSKKYSSKSKNVSRRDKEQSDTEHSEDEKFKSLIESQREKISHFKIPKIKKEIVEDNIEDKNDKDLKNLEDNLTTGKSKDVFKEPTEISTEHDAEISDKTSTKKESNKKTCVKMPENDDIGSDFGSSSNRSRKSRSFMVDDSTDQSGQESDSSLKNISEKAKEESDSLFDELLKKTTGVHKSSKKGTKAKRRSLSSDTMEQKDEDLTTSRRNSQARPKRQNNKQSSEITIDTSTAGDTETNSESSEITEKADEEDCSTNRRSPRTQTKRQKKISEAIIIETPTSVDLDQNVSIVKTSDKVNKKSTKKIKKSETVTELNSEATHVSNPPEVSLDETTKEVKEQKPSEKEIDVEDKSVNQTSEPGNATEAQQTSLRRSLRPRTKPVEIPKVTINKKPNNTKHSAKTLDNSLVDMDSSLQSGNDENNVKNTSKTGVDSTTENIPVNPNTITTDEVNVDENNMVKGNALSCLPDDSEKTEVILDSTKENEDFCQSNIVDSSNIDVASKSDSTQNNESKKDQTEINSLVEILKNKNKMLQILAMLNDGGEKIPDKLKKKLEKLAEIESDEDDENEAVESAPKLDKDTCDVKTIEATKLDPVAIDKPVQALNSVGSETVVTGEQAPSTVVKSKELNEDILGHVSNTNEQVPSTVLNSKEPSAKGDTPSQVTNIAEQVPPTIVANPEELAAIEDTSGQVSNADEQIITNSVLEGTTEKDESAIVKRNVVEKFNVEVVKDDESSRVVESSKQVENKCEDSIQTTTTKESLTNESEVNNSTNEHNSEHGTSKDEAEVIQNKTSKKKNRCNRELQMLQEYNLDMFISADVMKATGVRTCTIAHLDGNNATSSKTIESISPPKVTTKSKVKKGKDTATSKSKQQKKEENEDSLQPRVVVKKTKISDVSLVKDVYDYFEENAEVEEYQLIKQKPCPKSKKVLSVDGTVPASSEELPEKPADAQLEIVHALQKTSKSNKKIKKKRNSWQSGVITKKKSKSAKKVRKDINYCDKSYNFGKNQKEFKCKICYYSGSNIVEHYKLRHPHSEVMISRLNTEQAKLASEENIVEKRSKPLKTKMYRCRFCMKLFKVKNLRIIFDHIIYSHTGEYKKDCSLCSTKDAKKCISTCNKSSTLPPADDFIDSVIGYMCGKCNYTQLSHENLKSHIWLRHFNEECELKEINLTMQNPKRRMLKSGLEIAKTEGMKMRSKKKARGIPENILTQRLRTEISLKKNLKAMKAKVLPKRKEIPTPPKNTNSHVQQAPETQNQKELESVTSLEATNTIDAFSTSQSLTMPSDSNVFHVTADLNGIADLNIKQEIHEEHLLEETEPTVENVNIKTESVSPDANHSETLERSIKVGLIGMKQKGRKAEYSCSIEKCQFVSDYLLIFMSHITSHSFYWNGFCDECNSVVYENHNLKYDKALEHLLSNHSNSLATNRTPVKIKKEFEEQKEDTIYHLPDTFAHDVTMSEPVSLPPEEGFIKMSVACPPVQQNQRLSKINVRSMSDLLDSPMAESNPSLTLNMWNSPNVASPGLTGVWNATIISSDTLDTSETTNAGSSNAEFSDKLGILRDDGSSPDIPIGSTDNFNTPVNTVNDSSNTLETSPGLCQLRIESVVSLNPNVIPSPVETLFHHNQLTAKRTEENQIKKPETILISRILMKTGTKTHQTVLPYKIGRSELFKCSKCVVLTDDVNEFIDHFNKHKLNTKYDCVYCALETKNPSLLARHIQLEHAPSRFFCLLCDYRAVAPVLVYTHALALHKVKLKSMGCIKRHNCVKECSMIKGLLPKNACIFPYQCTFKPDDKDEMCSQTSFSVELFLKHLKKHGEKPQLPCYICRMDTTSLNDLLSHMRLEHNFKLMSCSYCAHACDSKAEALGHLMLCHSGRRPLVYLRLNPNKECLNDDRVVLFNLDKAEYYGGLIKFIGERDILKSVSKNMCHLTKTELDFIFISEKASLKPPQEKQTANNNGDGDKSTEHSLNENRRKQSTKTSNETDDDSVIIVDSDDENNDKPNSPDTDRETTPSVSRKSVDDVLSITSDNITDDDKVSSDIGPNRGSTQLDKPFSAFSEKFLLMVIKGTGVSVDKLFTCGNGSCKFVTLSMCDFRDHLVICEHIREFDNLTCHHCHKEFRNINRLVEHIKMHGIHRYQCNECYYCSYGVSPVIQHMRRAHKITKHVTMPLKPFKNDADLDYFVVKSMPRKPGPKSRVQTATPLMTEISPLASLTPIRKVSFGPSEINQLPTNPILTEEIYCNVCNFGTKVRSNLLRHLQMHANEIAVPSVAPINPVPHLESNEMHFDKMANLALSSNLNKLATIKKKEVKKPGIPNFVPEQERFVCGSVGCKYISVDEIMLRFHWETLHSEERKFYCVHCNEVVIEGNLVSTANIAAHLRLHEEVLYGCKECTFVHHLPRLVEKHSVENHGKDSTNCIRKPSTQVSQAKGQSSEKDIDEWKCNFCFVRVSSLNAITIHCKTAHRVNFQYRCSKCAFSRPNKTPFAMHFKSKHGSKIHPIISVFDRVNGDENTTLGETAQRTATKRKISIDKLSEASNSPTNAQIPRIDSPVVKSASPSMELLKSNPSVEGLKGFPKGLPSYDAVETDGVNFKCPFSCNFTTSSPLEIEGHVFEELNYRNWSCDTCGYKTFTSQKILEHTKMNHGNKLAKRLVSNKEIEEWVEGMIKVQQKGINVYKTKQDVENAVSAFANSDDCNLVIDEKNSPTKSIKSLTKKSEMMKCPHCKFESTTQSGIALHVKRHWKVKPLKCGHCLLGYVRKIELKLHSDRAHPGLPVKAIRNDMPKVPEIIPLLRTCNKKTLEPEDNPAEEDSLLMPVQAFQKPIFKNHMCLKCEQTLLQEEFSKHKETCNGGVKYPILEKKTIVCKCSICMQLTPNLDILNEHFAEEHPGVEINYVLHSIGKPKSKRIFAKSNVPMDVAPPVSDNINTYACTYCNEKFLRFLMLLYHHNLRHTDSIIRFVPLTLCDLNQSEEVRTKHTTDLECCIVGCSHKAHSLITLLSHIRSHYISYKCHFCNAFFSLYRFYEEHVRQHKSMICMMQEDFTKDTIVQDRLIKLFQMQKSNNDSLLSNADEQSFIFKDQIEFVINYKTQPIAGNIQSPVKFKQVARKSTTYIGPITSHYSPPDDECIDVDEYSFYGKEPEPVDLKNIKTHVEFSGIQKQITIAKLKEIENLFPKVVLRDIMLE